MRDFEKPVTERQKAVIYCRVSSARQKQEGHGLESQEHRCRQHAALKGYEVEAVFPDDASGGGDFMKRPGMVALLSYLDAQPDKRYAVIFDDLKRFARDRDYHFKLRDAFRQRDAMIECLNYAFDESPEGEFVETVFAAQGQLERKQNARQVTQKMRARVEKGYYCFAPVLGYEYVKLEGGGKVLAPSEPNASIVREALQGFASGRFQSPIEVKRFLDGFSSTPKNKHGEVRLQLAIETLRRPLYAGYITVEKWGIHLHPGKHEPLIDFATWQKIQDRLDGKANAPARKDLNEDFPLRGFVTCASCDHPMTAAWTKGRNAHYPYYFCQNRDCSERKKSIRKDKIEGDFEALLRELQPAPKLFGMARAMFKNCWDEFRRNATACAQSAKAEIAAIEKKTDQLMERIISADSETLIAAYEKQIKKLEAQKIRLRENAANQGQPLASFDELYRTACAFLSNPWKLWASEHLEHKRMVLRLAFPGRLAYCRNQGYRTAGIAEPFRLLGAIATPRFGLVGPEGLEPPT